MPDNR